MIMTDPEDGFAVWGFSGKDRPCLIQVNRGHDAIEAMNYTRQYMSIESSMLPQLNTLVVGIETYEQVMDILWN